MSEREIHLNDIGTRILLQFTDSGTPFDFSSVTSLSSISSLFVCLTPPLGVTKTFALTFASSPSLAGSIFAGDGSDGWTDHTIVSSADWDEIGQWSLQGRVIYPGGDFHSEKKAFDVFSNDC